MILFQIFYIKAFPNSAKVNLDFLVPVSKLKIEKFLSLYCYSYFKFVYRLFTRRDLSRRQSK